MTVTADLTNAYWRNSRRVQSWTRTLELTGDTLRVTDACRRGGGRAAGFPAAGAGAAGAADGRLDRAGRLTDRVARGVDGGMDRHAGPEFSRGYRIDIRPASGCAFSFELGRS